MRLDNEKLRDALLSGSLASAERLLQRGALGSGSIPLDAEELEAMDVCGLRLLIDYGFDLSAWLRDRPRRAARALLLSGRLNSPCAIWYKALEPALHCAAHWDDLALAEALLEVGADPCHPDSEGSTPLSIAVCQNQPAFVRLLGQYGADDRLLRCRPAAHANRSQQQASRIATHRDMLNGTSALGAACTMKNGADLITALLPLVRDPNQLDGSGSAALHVAARQGRFNNVCALLADLRVDPNVLDKSQRTPYDLAESPHIQRQLENAGSQLPPWAFAHHHLTLAPLRRATSLRGVVFPFGFGPGENLRHADLRDTDLSRTFLMPSQLAWAGNLDGAKLPSHIEMPEGWAERHGLDRAEMPSPLRPPDDFNEQGAPCRTLRAARRTIVYRRIHNADLLPGGAVLENMDLRPLSGQIVLESLVRYDRFSGVIFPEGLDMSAMGKVFFETREFLDCDFSLVADFPSYVWSTAAALRAPRCPPGLPFETLDFRGIDLTDADFSLQIPHIARREVITWS